MKTQIDVQKVMTPFPHTIGLDQPLAAAKEMMKKHNIRHLPVQEGGQLKGIISKRDLDIASALEPNLDVLDVYIPEPYSVEAETPLEEVLEFMANEGIGCTLVTNRGSLIGIFTTVDACRSFANYLSHSEFSK